MMLFNCAEQNKMKNSCKGFLIFDSNPLPFSWGVNYFLSATAASSTAVHSRCLCVTDEKNEDQNKHQIANTQAGLNKM